MPLGFWIFLGLFLGLFLIALVRYGIILCKKNNYIGVFVLFVALNIFGLVLGWALLSNNRKILFDKLDKFLDKQLEEKTKK